MANDNKNVYLSKTIEAISHYYGHFFKVLGDKAKVEVLVIISTPDNLLWDTTNPILYRRIFSAVRVYPEKLDFSDVCKISSDFFRDHSFKSFSAKVSKGTDIKADIDVIVAIHQNGLDHINKILFEEAFEVAIAYMPPIIFKSIEPVEISYFNYARAEQLKNEELSQNIITNVLGPRRNVVAFKHLLLRDSVTALSRMKYEKKICHASMTVDTNIDKLRFKLELDPPIDIKKTRRVRKLLELTDENHSLITDGLKVYGICETKNITPNKKRRPNLGAVDLALHFKFVGYMIWELYEDDDFILRYEEGNVSGVRYKKNKRELSEIITDQLLVDDKHKQDWLWQIIDELQKGTHGTTLVIHEDAESEAKRLKADSFPLKPFFLESQDATLFSSIDGAILINPDGICHAVGAILDGMAVPGAQSSRGSRYNSALRYYCQNKHKRVMIVVVSDDGMVDIFPDGSPDFDNACELPQTQER